MTDVTEPPFSGPALEVMQEVFFAFTPEGKILQWNQRVREVTGYSDEEIAKMHPSDFVPAEEVDLIKSHIEKALEDGQTRLEARFQTKEGELIPYEFTGTLFEHEGEALICGTGRDISKRKQAEEKRKKAQKDLEASEERYRRLFEDALEGITISTPEGEIKEANPAAARIMGYTREELKALDAVEVFFDPEERKEAVEELEAKGALEQKELRLRRKDGTGVICELSTTIRRGPEGEPEAFQNFFRDVTEKKKAEEALKESEKWYRRLFEESRDAVVLTTPEGNIVGANEAAEKLFGYSREELRDLNAADLYADPEERERRIVPKLEEATSSRLLEAEMRHREGHTFLASASVTLHRDEEGHPDLIQAHVRDITERKQKERELAAQKQKAEQRTTLMRLMQRVASAANDAERFEEALQEAVDATCDQTGWPVGHVHLPDEPPGEDGTERLVSSGIWNRGSRDQFEACRKETEQRAFAPGEGLPGQVFETGEPKWIEDVPEEETFLRTEAAVETGAKGAFAFPVLLKGEVIAVLEFFSTEAQTQDEELLEAMESVGMQLSRVAERERARQALEASEERFRRLFENAQEGIGISTIEGEIEEVNPAATEIFGYSREELLSMETRELYVDPREQEEAAQELEEKGALEGRELRLCRANGEEIVCQVSTSVHQEEDGKPEAFQTFFRDVTERKEAEEALKESEEQFRKLAEGALVGIALVGEDGYQYVNPAMERITGYSREELLGKSPKTLVHPEDWPEVKAQLERQFQEGQEAYYETRFQTEGGETRFIESTASQITYQGEVAVIGTVQDVTERRRMQREMIRVQEEERRRIGKDLHDGVASQLTGASLKLNILTRKTEGDLSKEETTEALEEIQEIIKEGSKDVRRLSRGLDPGGLSEGDLPSALDQLATNVEGGHFKNLFEDEILLEGNEEGDEEEAEFSSLDGTLLKEDEATHLYRIAQEATSNARKYAEASEIVIRLRKGEGALLLEVEDNGKGFDPEDVGKEGLGLRSMRHRAELLSAQLDLESAPGEGTLVRCRLPL